MRFRFLPLEVLYYSLLASLNPANVVIARDWERYTTVLQFDGAWAPFRLKSRTLHDVSCGIHGRYPVEIAGRAMILQRYLLDVRYAYAYLHSERNASPLVTVISQAVVMWTPQQDTGTQVGTVTIMA